MDNAQKKEWAKTLFLKESLSQKEIATRVGVSNQTICKWVAEGNWEKLKVSISLTKEEQLKQFYNQIAELNKVISERASGERFPSSTEADTISKLATAINKIEVETSITEIIDVSIQMLEWLKEVDFSKAKELSNLFDQFIKEKLNKK